MKFDALKPLKTLTISLTLMLNACFQPDGQKNDRASTTSEGVQVAENSQKEGFTFIPFGSGGQLKMIYDRRQRPQAIFIDNKVYMVYNGGAPETGEDIKRTFPFVISYDLDSKTLSEEIKLGTKASGDQHYCPIIWSDNNSLLHILYGCHRTPGTHLISKEADDIGKSADDWEEAPQIRNSLSYPTIYSVYDNKKLIYFRTGEHRSSWSYLISGDEGKTWNGPENDVTDLNMGEDLLDLPHEKMNEASSYQTVIPSKDGKYLHVAFCYYDDNKKNLPEKFINPRYKTNKNFSFKFNLYYVKINLQTHEIKNFEGETVTSPINVTLANEKCMIWDTDWRGAGVPPDIIIDENDNPAFLHVLSEDTPSEFNYYFVRYANNKWTQSIVAPSSDDWNSCYLQQDQDGVLHAFIVVGDPAKLGEGDMDSRGGGNIEEWISTDEGNTWKMHRDLTPSMPEYAGWKFNNIQPIKDKKGDVKEGLFLFYGWKDSEARKGKAFLVIDKNISVL